MKKIILSLNIVVSIFANAQVPKNVVAEIFTNTRCGVCGSKDPGIFKAIHTYPGLIQIAYYPSAPYANCFFSLQNKAEYDGRTRNYGIYGSTPRVFMQGVEEVYGLDTTKIKPYLNQLSNYEVRLYHQMISQDSAQVNITVIKRATDASTSAKLYMAVGEDSITYAASNGINTHYGVMRKAISDSSGMNIPLPTAVNDSVTFLKRYNIQSNWNRQLLSGYAFLINETNKSMINAAQSKLRVSTFTTLEELNLEEKLTLYPNPSNGIVNVNYTLADNTILEIALYDLVGKKVKILQNENQSKVGENAFKFETNELNEGIYFIRITTTTTPQIIKLFIAK